MTQRFRNADLESTVMLRALIHVEQGGDSQKEKKQQQQQNTYMMVIETESSPLEIIIDSSINKTL